MGLPKRESPTLLGAFAPEGVEIARVVRVGEGRNAVVLRSDGSETACLLPSHIDPRWLAAASEVAPVEAAVLYQTGRAFVWAVYPDAAHEDVRAPLRLEGSSIVLRAGKTTIELRDEGLSLKASEIESRATGEQWLMGARLRFN